MNKVCCKCNSSEKDFINKIDNDGFKIDWFFNDLCSACVDHNGLMTQEILFEDYPKKLYGDILNEMLLLNSDKFDNGLLFDSSIDTKEKLSNHIDKGYNPNDYFECWSDRYKKSFCLIPKIK